MREEKRDNDMKKEADKFGDIRDEFKVNIAAKTPENFKPLDAHKHLCKICYKNQKDSVLMPCKHRLFCYTCVQFLESKECPVCRRDIKYTVKVYYEEKD